LQAFSIYFVLTAIDLITRRLNLLLAITHHDTEDNLWYNIRVNYWKLL